MYIIMDLVINHCSDQHEWFQNALADPDGEYADYFYFRKAETVIPQVTCVLTLAEAAGNLYRVLINTTCTCLPKNSPILTGKTRF